jgi:undecaprenyl-diphosphatase
MLINIDKKILYFLNSFALSSWSFDVLVQLLERNMLFKGAVFVCLFWILWFPRKDGVNIIERRKTLLASLIGTMFGVFTTVLLTIVLPYRARPVHDSALALAVPSGVEEILEGWSAFPSDTATLACGLAIGIFLVSRTLGLCAVLYALIFVFIPRVYLGLHYPTDILAGIMIGATFVVLANVHSVKELLSSRILEFSERYPGTFYGMFFLFSFELGNLFLDLRDIGDTFVTIWENITIY